MFNTFHLGLSYMGPGFFPTNISSYNLTNTVCIYIYSLHIYIYIFVFADDESVGNMECDIPC